MGNLAKERISELEAEVSALAEANVGLEDQVKALADARDAAVALAASKDEQIEGLKAQIEAANSAKADVESTLDEKVKAAVADALASAGHDPVASGETSATGNPEPKPATEMSRGEAAAALVNRLIPSGR